MFNECISIVSIKWSVKSFNLFLSSLPTLFLPLTDFCPANFLSYSYEDDLGLHLRTYTVSDDGDTLIYEEENCIVWPNIAFTRTEVEFNPCD